MAMMPMDVFEDGRYAMGRDVNASMTVSSNTISFPNDRIVVSACYNKNGYACPIFIIPSYDTHDVAMYYVDVSTTGRPISAFSGTSVSITYRYLTKITS